jgi:hypothetical protein
VLAFQHMRSFDLKSLVAAAKRPIGKGETTYALVRSRSRVTSVALEWHRLRYLYLGSGTHDARGHVSKTRWVPLPFIAGLSGRSGPAIVSKKQKSQCRIGLGPNS